MQQALTLSDQPVYVATAEARDDEMKARITQHKNERGNQWRTLEVPLKLCDTLSAQPAGQVLLVDCLTLWLSNVMLGEQDVARASKTLVNTVHSCPASVILVANEVGMGLVPETPLGRSFRDAQGRLNQQIAEVVDTVYFVAAGLPLKLK